MTEYAQLYAALCEAGCSDEDAAAITDRALCEDALARELGRQPTVEEVEREYQRLAA